MLKPIHVLNLAACSDAEIARLDRDGFDTRVELLSRYPFTAPLTPQRGHAIATGGRMDDTVRIRLPQSFVK